MPDDPQQPVSSDEMIRRARDTHESDSAEQMVLDVPEDTPSGPEDDFQLPTYAAVQREAAAIRQELKEKQAATEPRAPAAPDAGLPDAGLPHAGEGEVRPPPVDAAKDSPAESTSSAISPDFDNTTEDSALAASDEVPQTEFEDAFGSISATSGTQQTNGPDSPTRFRPKASWLKWLIPAGVVVFALFRLLDSSTGVDSLEVGQCFDDPGSSEIHSVDVIDCSDWHDFEIFAIVVLTGNEGAFPGDDPLFEELTEQCFDRFEGYVGRDYASSQYDFSGLTPLEEAWSAGEREGICLVYRFSDTGVQQKTSSAANSGI